MAALIHNKRMKQRIKPKSGVVSPNLKPSRFEEYDYTIPGPAGRRKAGRPMGSSFAKLSGSESQRVEHMSGAIASGFRDAAQRDEITNELSSDPEFLESLGFGKPR
jgi:hypothetical protein